MNALVGFARRLAGPPRTAGAGEAATSQWGLLIDLRRCDGCRACTVACQEAHDLPVDQEWIRVHAFHGDDGTQSFMPQPCMQCERPPCTKACPVRATFRNKAGVVLVDQQRCIGCRACEKACPYGARTFNPLGSPGRLARGPAPRPEFPSPQRPRTVGKCVLCVGTAEAGGLPACVSSCTANALYLVDLGSDVMRGRSDEPQRFSEYAETQGAYRYREDLGTGPRVWYAGERPPVRRGPVS